jgi:hypothetical protein
MNSIAVKRRHGVLLATHALGPAAADVGGYMREQVLAAIVYPAVCDHIDLQGK